ncbi:2-dehydropantoate 2-reductase [Hoeflea prorocentri]|uniref:2-dehydropantoate 2-reductase n=1 Tax=Hoeflea prorocentri TaxID=1922333 RepID=A0A9X3UGC1_9HYPH|nr:2-dehydropantoate 2-reductase [Hoeflea prorocentri]MCY6380838.1 2-dehydropantoate 2-reductase [Hoeflea prorocentri]MDA5398638.1 2-dehydropantoate 2-reductase [Hoeflea prorocentri]
MTDEADTIGVFGAGAIGCYVGGMLAASGLTVHFLGRESAVETLQQHGLTLTRFDGPQAGVPSSKLKISSDPAVISKCDLILFCVKSQSTPEAAVDLAPHLKSSAKVISLQNGVGNVKALEDALGAERVFAGMVPFNVLSSGEGRFHRATAGNILLADDPATRQLAQFLTAAGLTAETSSDMDAVLWGKLLLNLNNALNVLSDVPLVRQLSDRDYRTVLAAMVKEALVATSKAGIRPAAIGRVQPWLIPHILRLPDWLFMRVAQSMLAMDDKARSSMWDDLQKNRQPEIDYLNGAIVRLAEEMGTPAPVNRKVIELVKDAFGNGRSPALSGAALRQMAAV